MAKKICPECQTTTGPRTLVCRNCGYEYNIGVKSVAPKSISQYTTNGRGKKTCPKCTIIVGARIHTCICGHKFERVSRLNKAHQTMCVDWRDLQKDDIIAVKRNTGPYWQLKTGEVEYLGEYGIFKVAYLCKQGIHAYPVKTKYGGGHRFIYMGDYNESPIGIIREPHRIRKITKLNALMVK